MEAVLIRREQRPENCKLFKRERGSTTFLREIYSQKSHVYHNAPKFSITWWFPVVINPGAKEKILHCKPHWEVILYITNSWEVQQCYLSLPRSCPEIHCVPFLQKKKKEWIFASSICIKYCLLYKREWYLPRLGALGLTASVKPRKHSSGSVLKSQRFSSRLGIAAAELPQA